jgi:hypothetical protein
MPVYFDTNIIRYLKDGLSEQALSEDEKRQVVLSPISVIELVAQIAACDEALSAVHALRSWIDTDRAELLEWTEVFIAHWVFSKDIADWVSARLKRVLRVCYESERPSDKLRKDAAALSEFLEKSKRRKATLLENAARAIRQTPNANDPDNLREGTRLATTTGLRARVGDSGEIHDEDISRHLVAYFEYHADLIERSIPQNDFNFFSRVHLNDHFDAEQLLFLADPRLHFFTSDRGYRGAANVEPRVHILEAAEVQDPKTAPNAMTVEIQRIVARGARP